MPSVQATLSTTWRDGAVVQGNAFATSWRDGVVVTSTGGTYAPGAPPPGGGGVVVDPSAPRTKIVERAVDNIVHTLQVLDLRDGAEIHLDTFDLATDEDSAWWTLRAGVGKAVNDKLTTGQLPAKIQLTLSGQVWRFVVDGLTRTRQFPAATYQLTARSLSAQAGAPFAAEKTWVNEGATSAAQLAAFAAAGGGLDVMWGLADWNIPDKVFSLAGATPLKVVQRVAETVQAIVQGHRTLKAVRVVPRYPLMPNEWPTAAPDIEIPISAVDAESFERADRPPYDGVYLSGQQSGELAFVTLAGTAGATLHPLVTDLLLTDQPALAQRGAAILAASGDAARVTQGWPLLAGPGEPGVPDVGMLVRVLDTDTAWYGLVRSVSLRAAMPSVQMSVVLERRTSLLPGTYAQAAVPSALRFAGPVPDQVAQVGVPFTLALAPYFVGAPAPLQFVRRAGALPAAAALNRDTGVLSATFLAPAALQFAARCTDAVGGMADSNTFNITVTA